MTIDESSSIDGMGIARGFPSTCGFEVKCFDPPHIARAPSRLVRPETKVGVVETDRESLIEASERMEYISMHCHQSCSDSTVVASGH